MNSLTHCEGKTTLNKFKLDPTLGLHTFSDLEKQPNFTQNVKLTDELSKNAKIVEPYRIGPDLIPCGLTCKQGHNRGYLLRLIDGSHTNVGICCGMNYFGASDFANQMRSVDEAEKLNFQKKQINELIDLIPEYRKRAHSLWGQSRPLYSALENFKAIYPEAIIQDLRNSAQRKSYSVEVARRQIDIQQGSGAKTGINSDNEQEKDRKVFVQEKLGNLSGIEVFVFKPRQFIKLAKNLLNEVDQSNSNISRSKISKLSRYKDQIENHFDSAKQLINSGERFFKKKNFDLLGYLCNEKYYHQIERIEWDFKLNTGRILSDGQLKRMRRKAA